MIKMILKNILKHLSEAKNEIVGGVISGIIISIFLSVVLPSLLTPKTEISVSCERNRLNPMDYDFNFTNNADFSGDNFKIFIYSDELAEGMIMYKPPLAGELCKDTNKIAISATNPKIIGISIGCEYIPPKSTIQFTVSPNKSINNSFKIKYWSKTTKFTEETKTCV